MIREIPFSKTSETLQDSIVKAIEKGKIKARKVEDLTAANVEIQVHLAPGVSSDKTIDALFAFTDCEINISPNCCVIEDNKPKFLTISDVLRHSVDRTKDLIRQELEIRKNELLEQLHFQSLGRWRRSSSRSASIKTRNSNRHPPSMPSVSISTNV